MRPRTRYAKSGDVHVAYQVFGEGETDIVIVHGLLSHVDLYWDWPLYARFMERLSAFARVIVFDKRGVGLSDRVTDLPALEERMDDVRAVMDAAGSERAALFGISEGAPMSLLFAATQPDRVSALVLHGGMAKATADVDYPFAAPGGAVVDAMEQLIEPHLEGPVFLEIFYPSLVDDPREHEPMQRRMQASASPATVSTLLEMALEVDVRSVLPSVQSPTLILHRYGDRAVSVHGARWMAQRIPDAKLVELEGQDHFPWTGDQDSVLAEIEEFLTGVRVVTAPERVLVTVMFTDIVGSTDTVVDLGDEAWRRLLDQHHDVVRRYLARFRGREVDTAGDGFLAVFDGPASAVRCAQAVGGAVAELGLEIRVGLHTGEVELRGEEIAGLAVHIGARIAGLAGPGEVLVSRTVKELVTGSGIAFESRGDHELKGVPDTWQVYAAVG